MELGELTFDNTQHQADLVAVSGHGGAGEVFGKASGEDARIELQKVLATHVGAPCTGRLKYLLVPSCSNCSYAWSEEWLPVLQKKQPVHGIFGFSGKYSGDAVGATLMRNFAATLRANPAMPLLDAWARVNMAHRQDWGAVQLLGARADSLQQWVTGGLQTPSDKTVIHYDRTAFPSGRPTRARDDDPKYDARFVMNDGTVINRFNNRADNAAVGLFPGKQGTLVVRAYDTPFPDTSTVRILFYYWRPQKIEVDLDNFLIFDEVLFQPGNRPRIEKLKDANPEKEHATGKYDGIQVSGFAGTEIRLPFVVSQKAHSIFKEDSNGMHTHGFFSLGLYPPGSVMFVSGPSIYSPANGSFLR
ncbi:hypothetical protein [Pendulispora albinea]|uniref:Uncharacterized protein n=1 Tax=Pendulispora albinea TaxID=2741071 RepID=A0ABZ2M5S2_9BACT